MKAKIPISETPARIMPACWTNWTGGDNMLVVQAL
jgi:hypothetical protein